MRLVDRPKRTALDVIHFRDIQEALECSQSILETGPYAVELTDKMILDLARGNIEQSKRMGFVQGDPAAILIVEYAGRHEATRCARRSTRWRPGASASASATPPRIALDPARAAVDLEAAQGRASACSSARTATPSRSRSSRTRPSIPSTCRSSWRASARSSRATRSTAPTTATARWAACTSGPAINIKTARGIEQVKAIADEITDLVVEFNGTISSEHGDGRARSPFLERMYGPRIMQAFRELKRAFDPDNRLNPGNIVASPPRHRASALRRRLQDVGADHAARLLAAGRLRGGRRDVQRGRASAARSSRARCAPRTWPRGTRSTRRAAGPTRCARCCPASCRRRSSRASASTR